MNNDFDVGSLEQEWEQEEEDKIGDYDTFNSEYSDKEEGDLDGGDHVERMDGDEVEDNSEEEEMLFATLD